MFEPRLLSNLGEPDATAAKAGAGTVAAAEDEDDGSTKYRRGLRAADSHWD